MIDRSPVVKPQQRANRGARATALQQIRREIQRGQETVAAVKLRLDYVEALVSTVTHEDPHDAHSHPAD